MLGASIPGLHQFSRSSNRLALGSDAAVPLDSGSHATSFVIEFVVDSDPDSLVAAKGRAGALCFKMIPDGRSKPDDATEFPDDPKKKLRNRPSMNLN